MNPKRYLTLSSLIVLLCGFGVLVGWQWDIEALTRIAPTMTPMNPLTAFGFILIAAWQLLRLRQRARTDVFLRFALPILGLLVLTIGIHGLYEIFTDQRTSLNWMFFQRNVGYGRIAPPTALNFVLCGGAMLLTALKAHRNLVLVLIVPVFITGYFSLFGYCIGLNNGAPMKPFLPMAFHSAAAFILLSFSFLFNFPSNSLTQVWLASDSGGYIARRLLPYVFLVPTLLGIVRYYGEEAGYYDTGFGVAMIAAGSISVMVIVVLRQAYELSIIDGRRKEAERQLLQQSKDILKANEELKGKNRELEQFTYAASHDMKEPVRKIHFYSDMLRMRLSSTLDADSLRSLQRIQLSAQRMNELIEDLLLYARVTNEKEHIAAVDLGKLTRSVLEDLDLDIEQRAARVEVGPMPSVWGHPRQLQQLLQNLISNALKYGRPGIEPHVKVSASQCEAAPMIDGPGSSASDFVKISVADNGIGIPADDRERVFELFTRLQDSGSTKGSGIGLAIVKKIVDNHNGRILVHSKVGEGSAFEVYLPANNNHG